MKNGQGTTVVFGTSAFAANKVRIGAPNLSRKAISSSHLGTSGYETFEPGDLVNAGEIRIDFEFDPGVTPPIDQAAETITITDADGDTMVFSGFMTNYGGEIPMDDKMTGSATIKITGEVTYTAAS
jgi:hypothetical protein